MFYQKVWFNFSVSVNVLILWGSALSLEHCLSNEPGGEGKHHHGERGLKGRWWGAWGVMIRLLMPFLYPAWHFGRCMGGTGWLQIFPLNDNWISTASIWMSHWQFKLTHPLSKSSEHPSYHPDIRESSSNITLTRWPSQVQQNDHGHYQWERRQVSGLYSFIWCKQKGPSPLWSLIIV